MSNKIKSAVEKVQGVKTRAPRTKLVLVPNEGGSLSGMFADPSEPLGEGMRVKSRSPMIKPDSFPEGRRMRGILKSLITCIAGKDDQGQDKAGCLVEFVPSPNEVGICLPAVATILGALEIKCEGKGKDAIFTTPFLNHRVEIEKLRDKIPSKKGNDAWNFLVAVSEKPVMIEA